MNILMSAWTRLFLHERGTRLADGEWPYGLKVILWIILAALSWAIIGGLFYFVVVFA